jgi:hypothetical protein
VLTTSNNLARTAALLWYSRGKGILAAVPTLTRRFDALGIRSTRTVVGPTANFGFREAIMPNVLSDQERSLIDAYWRAANYLAVGQIYLYDNPLLNEPLSKEHIKPRLLGHWGRRRD